MTRDFTQVHSLTGSVDAHRAEAAGVPGPVLGLGAAPQGGPSTSTTAAAIETPFGVDAPQAPRALAFERIIPRTAIVGITG